MQTIALHADLHAEDDALRWRPLLAGAVDPSGVVPGALVVAWTERFAEVSAQTSPAGCRR